MSTKTYLTPEQVQQLHQEHGWFAFGDAQNDVSKAFAQDAIAMHERMRAAAPDLLAALQSVISEVAGGRPHSTDSYLPPYILGQAIAAIEKATGRPA